MVLKHSSLSSIPHLENIITTVLDESAKNYQVNNLSSFLKVFQMILSRIYDWTDKLDEDNINEEFTETLLNKSAILSHWLSILNEPEIKYDDDVDNSASEQQNDTEILPEPEDEPKKPDLPQHIQITLTILKRCIKYLSLKSRLDKCLIIDSLTIGLEIIKHIEGELLPMIHSIWLPFVERLKETDTIVLQKCFSLLIVLGRLGKDFLYKRTSK